MSIDINKKYRTKSGDPVTILKTGLQTHPYYDDKKVLAIIHHTTFDEVILYDENGIFKSMEGVDLIEVSPYEDFKIDDKVLVWDGTGLKNKRHFAGVNEAGKPMVWENGHTSWTTTFKTPWDHCEKADENT